MAHSPKHSTSNPDSNSLLRQNQELRERLQEDAALYRRRLDTYKQAQQNQAALVARLQSKVLQYKKKCNELEDRMCDPVGPPNPKPVKVTDGISYSFRISSGLLMLFIRNGQIFINFCGLNDKFQIC